MVDANVNGNIHISTPLIVVQSYAPQKDITIQGNNGNKLAYLQDFK
jgi:hypothetical protein